MDEMCHVCGGELDGENVSRCLNCGQPFHMAWSTEAQVPQCGRAWIDDESLTLRFVCHRCSQGLAQAPEEPMLAPIGTVTSVLGLCHVCGQPLDEENVSRCLRCGRPFHMAWSTAAQVPQCGTPWLHEEYMTLGFLCNTCASP